LAVPGRRSVAAFPGACFRAVFPSCQLSSSGLACVWLSCAVSSSSPVVAAVGLALARSLRLGPPLDVGNRNAIKRNQPLRPWRRGRSNQQPRTTHAHDRRSPLHPLCFATGVPGTCGSHNHDSTHDHQNAPPASPACNRPKAKLEAGRGLAGQSFADSNALQCAERNHQFHTLAVRSHKVSSLALGIASRSQPRSAQPAYASPLSDVGCRARVLSFVPGGPVAGHHWPSYVSPRLVLLTTFHVRRHRAASPLIERHSPRPSHCPRARRSVYPVRMSVRIPTHRVIERPTRARASTRKLALRGNSTMRR
jgi:hypothetical protein